MVKGSDQSSFALIGLENRRIEVLLASYSVVVGLLVELHHRCRSWVSFGSCFSCLQP